MAGAAAASSSFSLRYTRAQTRVLAATGSFGCSIPSVRLTRQFLCTVCLIHVTRTLLSELRLSISSGWPLEPEEAEPISTALEQNAHSHWLATRLPRYF